MKKLLAWGWVLALALLLWPAATTHAAGLPEKPAGQLYLSQAQALAPATTKLLAHQNQRLAQAKGKPVLAVAVLAPTHQEKSAQLAADLLQEWHLTQRGVMIVYVAGKQPQLGIAAGTAWRNVLTTSQANRIAQVSLQHAGGTSAAAVNRLLRRVLNVTTTQLTAHLHVPRDATTLSTKQMQVYQPPAHHYVTGGLVLVAILVIVGGLYALLSGHGRRSFGLLANLVTGRGGLRPEDVTRPAAAPPKPKQK